MKWLGIYFATVLYGVKIISKRIFLCMCILKYFSKYGFAHFEHPFYVSKIKSRETQIEKLLGKIALINLNTSILTINAMRTEQVTCD